MYNNFNFFFKKNIKRFLLTGSIVCSFTYVYSQKIAELKVAADAQIGNFVVPVSVDLDAISLVPTDSLYVVELVLGKQLPVPYQIENHGRRTLYWLLQPNRNKADRIFALIKGVPPAETRAVRLSENAGALVISAHEQPLLQYNYKTHYPPQGVDTVFKRSGFIHPLRTPHGQALTRINAPDHYHHYGLWNPWTKVLFEGKTVDFWNLVKKEGTVRFGDFVSTTDGAVFGGYQALHKHVVFGDGGAEKVAMNELQSIKIYRPDSLNDCYLLDITIRLNCASSSPVTLKEYRYGGLGWRATAQWNKYNSEILTSAGKTRKDADNSKGRWVIVQGRLDQDYGGAVMMSYPSNYNYPEPLRIWPENIVGEGDVYANFSPTKDRDWVLQPGTDYVLKYRFLVFNGKFDAQRAEAAWNGFAHPPKVMVKRL